MLFQSQTQLETAIGAVSRIRSFVSRTQNEALPGEIGKLPDNWPDKGDITFNKMSVSYSSANEVVLKDIDFSIPAGKKVAICGRTGRQVLTRHFPPGADHPRI